MGVHNNEKLEENFVKALGQLNKENQEAIRLYINHIIEEHMLKRGSDVERAALGGQSWQKFIKKRRDEFYEREEENKQLWHL